MKIFVFVFMCFLLSTISIAQINYEPINNNIYDFLEDISIKGIVKYNDEVKPLSRSYIAKILIEIDSKKESLSNLEKEELEFYYKEYFDEMYNRNATAEKEGGSVYRNDLLKFGKTDRLRFFSYYDSLFTINVDPILGYTIGSQYGASYLHRWNGASTFGSFGNNIGFDLNFMDNLEQGNNIDRKKSLTQIRGMNIIKENKNSIEYTFVNASISYNWNWGTISLGKDYQTWGSGKNGQLILSDKAPSFPMIKLEIAPTDWLRFVYIHGWLYSGIMDSSTFRYGIVKGRDTYSQIPNFIAAHMVSIDLKKNIAFSLGESIIYSDKIQPYYLIPIMVFRIADQNLQTKGSNSGSNAQLFGNISYIPDFLKVKLYSTIFVDELSLEDLFSGKDHSAIGFTFGGKFVNPIIENSSVIIEYTRINPFVYMNSDLVEQYASHGYQLGHWMGSNGINLYCQYSQKVFRGLNFNISGELVKKGKKELHEEQYEPSYPSILYGNKYNEKSIVIEISYEYIHDLFVKLNYKYSDISDEDKTRTPSFMLGKQSSFGVSVYYGM